MPFDDDKGNSDFRIVGPIPITDAILTSSSIPEVSVTVWASGTTYASGNRAGVAGTKNSQVVYESVQNGNTNHTPASSPTWWKAVGTVYFTYAGGSTYALGDIVTDVTSHTLYESQAAGNTGHALTDTAYWLPIGNTNRWAMFDKAVQTQTTSPSAFTMTLTPDTVVNTLVALNVQAQSIRVVQAASGYDKTQPLTSHNVLNWYDYWYQSLLMKTDTAFDDIPPYIAPIEITLTPSAGAAAVGVMVLSKYNKIGLTRWDFTGGVLSYSTTTETKGVIRMVKRPSAKKLNFEVFIDIGYADEAYRLLTKWTDTEIVIIGTTDYPMAIAYGYLGQWQVPVSINCKPASIEFRGLT